MVLGPVELLLLIMATSLVRVVVVELELDHLNQLHRAVDPLFRLVQAAQLLTIVTLQVVVAEVPQGGEVMEPQRAAVRAAVRVPP
jgi:hypothetical protein